MKKPLLTRALHSFQNTTVSPATALLTFAACVVIRLCVEMWTNAFAPQHGTFYFFEFLHTALFFYIVFMILALLFTKVARFPLRTAGIYLLFGVVCIIFPPIWDYIISHTFFHGRPFLSYYLFDSVGGLWHSFYTFFGDRPYDGITYGTRIMIGCALLCVTLLTWHNTKNIVRTGIVLCGSYIIFFFFSAFPSLITFAFGTHGIHSTHYDVAGFIASPTTLLGNQIQHAINSINIKMSFVYMVCSIIITILFFYATRPRITRALLINTRPVQLCYHIGLLCIGGCTALFFNHTIVFPTFFTIIAGMVLCFGVMCAWYATVIFNDIVDKDIDRITNTDRPLVTGIIGEHDYKHIGIFLTVFSCVCVAMINVHAALLLVVYHAISFVYNMPPLRLKRFPLVATFLASFASFLIVCIGFIIITPAHDLHGFPPHIALLLIITLTISLPIKDLKDTCGDKKNHVYTIPVLCGDNIGRLLIGTNIFISFIVSIFMLNNFALFFPAMLAGSLCFWILAGQKNAQFVFSPKKSLTLVFGITCIYAGILLISFLV